MRYAAYIVFVVLTDLYGTVMVVLLALKLLFNETWAGGVVGLFNSLFPSILLPSLVMLPVSVYLRRKRLALMVLPAFVVFFANYAYAFLPRAAVRLPADARVFSLLTYNLHAETVKLDPMIEIVQTLDADIVLLQEFTLPAAERFAPALAERYPYHDLRPVGVSVYGKGAFSRFPTTENTYTIDGSRVLIQRLLLDIDGVPLVLYNIHPSVPRVGLPYDASQRSDDIARIMALAEKESLPVIIAGDFNMTDQSDDYRKMHARYTDVFRESGFGLGLTFPDFGGFSMPILPHLPQIVRLDYVFTTPAHFQSLEARVWHHSGGSDHRPLFVRLALLSPNDTAFFP